MPDAIRAEQIRRLRTSDLFDGDWYLSRYPDVARTGLDPAEHFVRIGWQLGRRPNRTFGTGEAEEANPVDSTGRQRLLARLRDLVHPAPALGPARPTLPAFEICGEHASGHSGPALVLAEGMEPDLLFHGTLAAHLHLFHADMASAYRHLLAALPVPFDLYVSVATSEAARLAETIFGSLESVHRLIVETHPNRGRDLGPMVAGFGDRLRGYDFLLHLHTKQSGHTAAKRDWGAHLGHHLLHSRDHATRVLNLFAEDPALGLVFPVYHPSLRDQIKWGANLRRCQDLLRPLGLPLAEADLLPFPAGSFFFARTEAILPLFDAGLGLADFEPEAAQLDGTLAHAIERLFPILCARRGFTFRQVRAGKPHSLSTAWLKGDPYRSRLLDRLRHDDRPVLPLHSLPALQGLRIAVFTCATGGYDRPLPFEALIEGAEYLFFSDTATGDTATGEAGQWQMRPLALSHAHPVKAARRHKTQPHRILPGVDIAVWIDGNIAVTGDITPLIARLLQAEASFGVMPHPYRTSVADEACALKRLKIDAPEVIDAQLAAQRAEGFADDVGLTESNFLVMDLRRPETRTALDLWWAGIDRHSHRDQLSFDHACWKAGARKVALAETGLSVRANDRFAYFDHGGARHPYLDTLPRLADLCAGRPPRPDPLRQAAWRKSVDVVICVHNSPDDVASCLASVARARDGRSRIIIVDDGSAPPTQRIIARHMAAHPSDLLLRHEVAVGYTRSANAGMKAATADYVILLNSDTLVPQGWVQALVEAGESDDGVGIVGPLSNAASWQSVPETGTATGEYVINDLPDWLSVEEASAICARIPGPKLHRVPLVNGFCFAIKRAVFDRIGYFDEAAFPQGYGEENDLCLRLLDTGMSCGITTASYVFHAKSKSFTHDRRKALSRMGWESLVARHSAGRLKACLAELADHPAPRRARQQFRAQSCRREPDVQPIGFYLPQFHPFPVNDTAWGPGFTEWRNVVKARPRFDGHPQPRLPGQLGMYDLRAADTLRAQADLAARYGLYGMAVYYYRFGRERLMSAPTDRLLADGTIPLRFFYCWANEDWTRAWDGRTSDLILQQDYTDETLRLILDDLLEAVADPRHIRVAGRPVFMIYQLNRLPDAAAVIGFFRDGVRAALGIEICLGTTWNDAFRPEWEALVDFIAQFPPHRTPRRSKRHLLPREAVTGASPETADYLESYDVVAAQSLEAADMYDRLQPGLCPDWDNSPRRARNASILVGSTPEKFGAWVRAAAAIARTKQQQGKTRTPFLFVNAWNEWAEGAALEPSEADGSAYLESFLQNVM